MGHCISEDKDKYIDIINTPKIQHLHDAKIKFLFARSNSHNVDYR